MAWDVRDAPVAGLPAEPYTGTRRRFPLVNRPMSVRVSVRFNDPVNVEYARSYDTSRDFRPTAEFCSALVRRLEHCSEELITRKDASALESGPDKPPRFEVAFQLANAPCTTKAVTFRSYQTKPPTMDQATDVILATDRMVGLFLIRHDKHFKWAKGPVREYVSGRPKTAKPAAGGSESLACVPRCRFFPSTQSYEFVPGYEIELHFNSTCSTRRPQKLAKTIRLTSSQCSPLNQAFGEEMLSAASKAVHSAIDSRKRALIGFRWLSAMNDTLSIDLRIKNNLGPDYDHLTYSLHSKQSLFNSPNGLDCIMFLDEIYRTLARVRDRIDDAIGATPELEVKVQELQGSNWKAADPLSIFLDPTISYSRRTVEAILDRVQTGVASILHGNDNTITLSILHRGHLVLDKTLVAHEDPAVVKRQSLAMTPEHEGNVVISKLSQRIQEDITMVCKDTCALDSRGNALPNLRVVQKSHATRIAELAPPETPRRSAVRQPLVYTPPPSSHSNLPRKDPVSARDDTSLRGSNAAIGAPPRTPRNNMRRLRHEDMDLTPPPTPSLIDSDLDTPRDSMIITPPPDIKYNRGASGPSGYEPQIVDDDSSVNDPIVRDFAHLASHVEPFSKDYRPERFVPMSKSDRQFGGALVPETPTPVQNIVLPPESEVGDLLGTPSKAAPARGIMQDPKLAPDQAHETTKDDAPGIGDSNQDTKGAAEPVLEGWLEYRCDPLYPPEPTPEQPPVSEPAQTLSKYAAASKPVLEGWLEYSCEPLEVITEEPEPIDLPLEGWLEYWCEPLDEEEEALSETAPENLESTGDIPENPATTESPVLEGWLEYWCEPLDPEEETKGSNAEVLLPGRESIRCPSIAVTEDENSSLLDHQQPLPSGGNTPATLGSLPSLLIETSGSESGTTSCSEVAYTAVECTGKELHLEMHPPSTTPTVFFDAPEAVAPDAVPLMPDEPFPSCDTGKQNTDGAVSTDVDEAPKSNKDPEAPLLGAPESLLLGLKDQDQEKEVLQVDVQKQTILTTSDHTSGQPNPPTPADEAQPGFFQGEVAVKGKEVAVELDSGQPVGSIPEAEEAEIARAVAEIDTAVERSREAGKSTEATVEDQQSREVEEEIAQAVAEINAAVERHAADQLAKGKAHHQMSLGEDGGPGLGISQADAAIDDAAVDGARTEEVPLVADKPTSQAEEEDLDIDRAVAEIDAADNSRATATREEKARRVLEFALKEKNSLEIARAIAEIDAAVDKRREDQEANDKLHLKDMPKRLERALTYDAIAIPPRPSRRLSLAGPRPDSLVLRSAPTLESFPALRTNSLPLPARYCGGVPFAGPSHSPKRPASLAGNVGLHKVYHFPLQDALLGTHSRGGFFGASTSSRASPVLSSLTAECKSGLPDPPRVAREEPKADELMADEPEEAERAAGSEDKKQRDETPPATPKTGYGAFPGFMFWAAGVTIASSVFRRA